MITKRKINKFLNELASDSITPGGGSAAAIVGATGVSLALMASRISMNRKSFKALPNAKQTLVTKSVNKLDELKSQIEDQADVDIKCFNNFMACYKTKDVAQIKKATKECFNAPYGLAKLCLDAYKEVIKLDPYIVDSVRSDLDMAYEVIKATLNSCKINMKINLTKYIDKASKKKYQDICKLINKIK